MKKTIITILIIIGIVIGYWLVSPLFLNKEVDESMEDIVMMSESDSEQTTLKKGTFVGADDFHKGEGTVKLIKSGDKFFIRFEDDFKVTNGPDLFVHFGKDGEYSKEARISLLKGNIGGQNYEVPSNIDVSQYNEVWIWCRAFSVPFASAELYLEL